MPRPHLPIKKAKLNEINKPKPKIDVPKRQIPIKYNTTNSEINQKKYNRKLINDIYLTGLDHIVVLDNGYRMGIIFTKLKYIKVPLDLPIGGEELLIETNPHNSNKNYIKVSIEKTPKGPMIKAEEIYSKKVIDKMIAEGKYHC
mgnify:CR=1 FL=1